MASFFSPVPSSFRNLAVICKLRGRLDEAFAHLRTLVAEYPDYAEAAEFLDRTEREAESSR